MYVRKDESKVDFVDCGSCLNFKAGGRAYFDTYFNGFSIEKWRKYTQIRNLRLSLRLKGKFEVELRSKESVQRGIAEKIIAIYSFDSAEMEEAFFDFPDIDTKGMLFFALKAAKGNSKFFGGYFLTDIAQESLHMVNIAINICTFRREAFVARNIEILKRAILENKESELRNHLQIYIADNGKTLDGQNLSGQAVHIFPNKNVGGAGGFTRGLIEIKRDPLYRATHALFMDDDVLIEPEALFRTYTFLLCIKEAYMDAFIGGAMLRLDLQNIQVESGATWNAGALCSLKGGLDLNNIEACLYNEVEEFCEYNAWWYCSIPMEVVREDNLPLPIFIRGDDLEYGLRNMKNLILLNGICVWHEPFENKYSSSLEYYILRNLLYDNALHCPTFSKWNFLKRLYGSVLRQLFYYRYQNVELIFRGVHDFFRGVPFLRDTDGERLHQEILSAAYKAQLLEKLDVPFSYGAYEASFHERESKLHRVMRLLTFNGFLFPARRVVVTSMSMCRPINFFRAKRVLQYDATSQKGFITEKRIGKTLYYLIRLIPETWNVLNHFDAACESIRREAHELMTAAAWKNALQI